jgi:hypothetical protein
VSASGRNGTDYRWEVSRWEVSRWEVSRWEGVERSFKQALSRQPMPGLGMDSDIRFIYKLSNSRFDAEDGLSLLQDF